MESIMRLAHSEAMLFKFGSGTGTDLTPIRSSKEKLSGGGRPSGPLSFLKVYDQVANVVKSGGKTRRAAKMNTAPTIGTATSRNSSMPNRKEEKKAWALIEQGYDGSYNGEAYGSVMYQNENLSVRASDDFMQAALENRPWQTRSVTTGKPSNRRMPPRSCARSRKAPGSAAIPGCSSTGPSRSGTPAKAPSPFTPPTRVQNMSSSTTPPAIWPR
jgi:ribonucleoside-diphosphate reductase alpha chain